MACRTIGGTYTAEGGVIDLRPLFSTLIGCETAIATQEAAVLERLGAAQTYGLDEADANSTAPPAPC